MRILITGAAGFMGSHLLDDLLALGHQVVGLDDYSIGRYQHKAITQMRLDGSTSEGFIEYFKPELVYHLTAWAHEGLSQFMPRHITENNYNAFLNLMVPAIRSGCKRFIICSSMSVYGAQKPPFNEDMLTAPEDVYAVAKDAMEKTTKILADVHGFDYTILRPHNVYGPRQAIWDPYRNVVGIFINRVMKGLPPLIYGDGEQTRAFSYIDDVIPYVMAAGFNENTKGQIINIGPTEEYSVNHLANCVLKAFESDLVPEHLPDRPREVKNAYSTSDKAIELLGYRTSVTLEEGIKRMVNWAKTIGPQEFEYLDKLELPAVNTPETWSKKLM